jgi:hypothetical protein
VEWIIDIRRMITLPKQERDIGIFIQSPCDFEYIPFSSFWWIVWQARIRKKPDLLLSKFA